MFGFLNVYKPKGKTSHDVVAILRRITKIKQIGHTGTLDPFAEGVLPICIGKATRLIEYLEDDKTYIGTVQFGKSTTTYDIEGNTVDTSEKQVLRQDVEEQLHHFRGEINQVPPIYSAIKVNGKKLYEYARKSENIKIEPRSVHISKLELINFDYEKQQAELLIECSKGTYIRSIANDIGNSLGCFAHLIKLVRTKAGRFDISKSIELQKLNTADEIRNNLIYPMEYLNFPKYKLSKSEIQSVSHGMKIHIDLPDGKVVLLSNNKLIAVAQIENSQARMLKVFI